MLRRKKQQPSKTVTTEKAVKATVKNLGNGTLEFVDNTVKFHLEKGHLKKQKEMAIKIPITDIENIRQDGKELSITWNGITDMFTAEKPDLLVTISEKITAALNEQKKESEDKKANEEEAKQKRNEVCRMLSVTMEIVGSLFDILRSLHGRIDWNRVESCLKRSEESAIALADQKHGSLNLEFTKLSSAAKGRRPEEVSKETYNILKSLQEHFSGTSPKNEPTEEIHPNYPDAETAIQAYYVLNDIILGIAVGDEETVGEGDELAKLLNNLPKKTNARIDIDAIKSVVNKLCILRGKESVIEESRALFTQQLKDLIAA